MEEDFFSRLVELNRLRSKARLREKKTYFREAVRKNKLHISWHWPKRWVGLGSNPNFFFLKNCDIYNRWVGAKHSCHNFINSKFCSKISIFPLVCQKWVNEKVWNCILLYIIILNFEPSFIITCWPFKILTETVHPINKDSTYSTLIFTQTSP